ncbi:subfamily B ATP-binding cassette MsbA [Candidatus Kinetoplastibacterium desouzaii TCC079E]|uniref:Subfamily B ATP-binding cassette MsbA n=1 Tax=Candidatus Kinetoplastidibacterium desouzai TCC079E TaxID=1208919 RepID=M1L1Y0_9PROT|nr:lipid A export permease/ATP-binding protein MsbA [Candidatus Kinetoplastibacterium desouzaii]AGF46753.1 subfamily B ATP-binding cassette MsbA [Candidatus Kinetoplastibacterium desouzaii TCC079E]
MQFYNQSKYSDQRRAGNLFLRVCGDVKKYWLIISVAIVLMVLAAATQPALALIMKPLLDKGFSGDYSNWFFIPFLLFILAVIRSVCNFCSSYLFALISNNILFDIRANMFEKLLGLPDKHYANSNHSRLLNKFTIDANNITNSVNEVIIVLIRESTILLALLVVLFYLSWLLTSIVIIMLPIMVIVTRVFIKRIKKISQNTLGMNAELTRVVSGAIKGQRVIKLFNGYDIEKNRFHFINKNLRNFAMRAAIADSALSPIMHLCVALSVAIVIFVALSQANFSMLTVGEFGAFIAALAQIPDPMRKLTNITGKLQKALVSAESVFSLIDARIESDFGNNVSSYDIKGDIDFVNVNFKFPGNKESIIKNVSFSIKSGDVVALVGRSGSGKTTLVNMLPRFIDPDEGSILLDKCDIKNMTLKSLRANISFVGQDVVLFNDSIFANICYGSSIKVTDKDVESALDAVNLLDFVKSLPKGLYTNIGEDALRLSGGQRQRLAIARAFIKNSPIIILDEATSALDNESERYIQDSLEKLMSGRTTLIIAHRLSTVRKVDCIFVMDSGTIIEHGSHLELLHKHGVYASLYRMQFDD